MKYIKQFENINWDDWDEEEYPDKPSLYAMMTKEECIYLTENDPSERRLILYYNYNFDNQNRTLKKINDQNIINDIINDKIIIRIPNNKNKIYRRKGYYSEISKEFNIIF